jgi:hypothetical protein
MSVRAIAVLGAAALLLAGGASADVLPGSAGPDVLRGTPSPDILLGREGSDRLFGGAGNDLLSGGRGSDTIVCGRGLDAVVADRADALDASCELVATGSGLRATQAQTPPAETNESSSADRPTDPMGTGSGSTGTADSDDGLDVSDVLLAWLVTDDGDIDWTNGIVYFLLGFLGAAVISYFFLGGYLPSMGGKAEYDAATGELDRKRKARDEILLQRAKLIESPLPLPVQKIDALDRLSDDYAAEIADLRDDISKERLRLVTLGSLLYVFIGAAFATVFATTFAQAVLIGAGWVAIADRFGLKRQEEKRTDYRDTQIAELENEAKRLGAELKIVTVSRDEFAERADELESELEQAGDARASDERKLADYRAVLDALYEETNLRRPTTARRAHGASEDWL